MKFILFVICLFSFHCYSQWNIIHNHADQEVKLAVQGTDTIHAISYNAERIHRSTDGGNSWTYPTTMFEWSWLNDIQFTSANIGYVCGGTAFGNYTSIVAKTEDGGLTWDSITSNQYGYSFNSLHFVNDDIGFISGDGGILLKTVDGGASFTLQPPLLDGAYTIYDIHFVDEQLGFLTLTQNNPSQDTDTTHIFKTTNQGATWIDVRTEVISNVSNFNNRRIFEIQFLNASIGYAVGGNGMVLKTSNGGISWEEQFLAPFNNITAVHFIDEHVGYINNAGGIYTTHDGGVTWQVQQLNPPSIVYDIEMANSEIGYAVTENGIYKTSTGGDLVGIHVTSISPIDVFPNPARTSISIKSNDLTIKKLSIIDNQGKEWIRTKNHEMIDITQLAKGSYIIMIHTDKGIFFEKFARI